MAIWQSFEAFWISFLLDFRSNKAQFSLLLNQLWPTIFYFFPNIAHTLPQKKQLSIL